MHKLKFNVYVCGMSEETFTKQIMIYRPINTISKTFSQKELSELGIDYVSDLIENIKQDRTMEEALGEWGLENVSVETVYIQYRDCLLGLLENKSILSIFNYFNCESLEWAYFIVGGASIHNGTSYRFTVHPNEDIHRHMPHVHVSKGNVEIRYSLETLQPIDSLVNPHRRDNKKIIVPFLRENQEKLFKFWNLYLNGYTSPAITQEGQQFYSES